MTTHLVWFRQDLRLHDNLALAAACRNSSARVLALYIATPRQWATHNMSPRQAELINAQLNQKLFRYYQKYPDRRIGFHCYHERVEGNTHSNIFLKIPPKQSHDLINIVLMIEDLWKQLGKRTKTRGAKFKLYQDYNVDDESRCTSYGRKENNYVPI